MPTFMLNLRGMVLAMLAFAVLGLAACAPATGSKVPAEPTPAPGLHPLRVDDLPPEIGDMVRGEMRTYDKPELGVSVVYSGPGMTATVYLYDGGLKNLPESLDDPVVVEHFKSTLHDVSSLIALGLVREVQVRDAAMLKYAGQPEYLYAQLALDTVNGPEDSFLFLTSYQGQFIKIRMTGPASDETYPRAMGFALILGRQLWPEAYK